MEFDKTKLQWLTVIMPKTVIATGIGNAMEWFDFGLYSYLAVIISKNFFSQVDNDQLKLVLHLLHCYSIFITPYRWYCFWYHWR